ncbi:MAG: phosphate signaling complex protein PhoU [Bacteroidia bacterium]|nr:phosphate signaling complex protein PhoU [Bacteroidia bacterium]
MNADAPAYDMKQLRMKLLRLSALAEENTRRAVLALRGRDRATADVVIANEAEINALEIEIEQDCVRLLSNGINERRDVQNIVSVLRINTDLERIGDLAANVARHVADVSQCEQALLPAQLLRMADCALAMLHQALDAFVDLDAVSAREVCGLDDEVDELNRVVHSLVRDRIVASPQLTDNLLSVLGAARQLERIADCATNIAEDVLYLVSGSVFRHSKTDSHATDA